MSEEEKIDKTAPHLVGKYFETNDIGTEIAFPPVDQHILQEGLVKENDDSEKSTSGCGGLVKLTEEGNSGYAWFYLTNNSNKYAGVTIEKQWTYYNERRRQTARLSLYPGQHKEVFSFPRNQRPSCSIIACNI